MLGKEEVKHISDLARLDLTEEEMETMSGQLTDVLSYVEKLQEVDVTNVEPTAQVTGLENVIREDEVEEWDKQEVKKALDQAPDSEGEEVKVRRILG